MERSDRHSWTGDAHPSQAASMVAFGNYDFVKQNLFYTSTQFNGIRMEAKRFCVENGYTFHNARSHEGLMRNMIVRTASTGEVMVIVVFNSDDRPRITALMDHLCSAAASSTAPRLEARWPGLTAHWSMIYRRSSSQ